MEKEKKIHFLQLKETGLCDHQCWFANAYPKNVFSTCSPLILSRKNNHIQGPEMRLGSTHTEPGERQGLRWLAGWVVEEGDLARGLWLHVVLHLQFATCCTALVFPASRPRPHRFLPAGAVVPRRQFLGYVFCCLSPPPGWHHSRLSLSLWTPALPALRHSYSTN